MSVIFFVFFFSNVDKNRLKIDKVSGRNGFFLSMLLNLKHVADGPVQVLVVRHDIMAVDVGRIERKRGGGAVLVPVPKAVVAHPLARGLDVNVLATKHRKQMEVDNGRKRLVKGRVEPQPRSDGNGLDDVNVTVIKGSFPVPKARFYTIRNAG
jgi:hypothetical protein